MAFTLIFIGFFMMQGAFVMAIEDLGVHGAIFPIEEKSLLEVIQQRLASLQGSKELQEFEDQLKTHAKAQALEPKPLSHITPTQKRRFFYYDPSLRIDSDIVIPKEVHGKQVVLAQKGQLLNPLHVVRMGRGLLFIDGEDPIQRALIETYQARFDIVLVKGKPLELAKNYKTSIFFDQGGILTTKFGIKHVPCKVEEAPLEKKCLQITEFVP